MQLPMLLTFIAVCRDRKEVKKNDIMSFCQNNNNKNNPKCLLQLSTNWTFEPVTPHAYVHQVYL